MQRKLSLILAMMLGLAAAGCDLAGDDNDGGLGDGGAPPDKGAPPTGELVTKKAGESAEVDVAAGTSYLVIPYSVSATAADAIDFEIKLTGGGKTTSITSSLGRPLRKPLKLRNPALWARWQQRLGVERWTRLQAVRASKLRHSAPGSMTQHANAAGCTLSSECKTDEVCAAGSCATSVTVKVKAFSSSTDTITAEVKAKGKVAAILVDKDDTVSAADLTKILKTFEDTIYPRDVALFGNPALKSGGSVKSSDRNGDGLVWLVMTKRTAEKDKAVGFFNAMDFTDVANSNKADILYINSNETKKLSAIYRIMAHELQHLLNYSSKLYKPKVGGGAGALEALWLDEGQAHFAEGACGYGGENVNLLSEKAFPDFGDYSIIYAPADDDLAPRMMAYLFVRYLFEQQGGVSYSSSGVSDKGGAAFLKKLHNTSKQGTAAVDEALGSSYKTAMDTWVAAMALDGRGVTKYGAHRYMALVDDPVTGNKIGVKIRGTRKDMDGKSVTLEGPNEEELTTDTDESVASGSAKYYLLKGKTGKLTIKVTSKASDFRFAVVKFKK